MSKFKKIIVVTVCLIILVFPFSVSASVSGSDIAGDITIGDFEIEIVSASIDGTQSGKDCDITTLTTTSFTNPERLRINITTPEDYHPNGYVCEKDTVHIVIRLKPTDLKFLNSNYCVVGSFEYGIRRDVGKIKLYNGSRYSTADGTSDNGIESDVSTDWGLYYKTTFTSDTSGSVYDDYTINLMYQVTGFADSYARYIYLQNFDFQALTQNEFNAQKIENSIDKHTDKIVDNQNANTDKIMNGDEDIDSKAEANKVDGAMGDIDGATDSAMGGKTDEEVQEEINNALDSEKIGLDFNKAQRISTFFDDTLTAFGVSYKTLLMLSLALGLAAFLIGRRYG